LVPLAFEDGVWDQGDDIEGENSLRQPGEGQESLSIEERIGDGMRIVMAALVLTLPGWAGVVEEAQTKYQRTDYRGALVLLEKAPPGVDALRLSGQCHYYLRDYKRAVEVLERADKTAPGDAAVQHWLGRAWGRRAETANVFQAPGFAVKARKAFERAVELDPGRVEAVSDLLEYFVEAPGFLGGGLEKAEALAESHLRKRNPAQYHFALAQIARKRKQDDVAERALRRAAELEPGSSGRLADLGRFLGERGRMEEAEEMFAKAAKLEPKAPGWRMALARLYVEKKVKTGEARRLLEEYLQLPLTPDDEPRGVAEAMLKRLR
jgi:tetratricopeptide (TPR) repeat protein